MFKENYLTMADQSHMIKAQLKYKDQLLRTIAHDLRNPLGGISSLAALLIEEDQPPAERTEILEAIKEAATHSLHLVQKLLTSEEALIDNVFNNTVNLHHVIESCILLSKHQFVDKGLELKVNLFNGDAEVRIEQEKMIRVIDNLISNALKFTQPLGHVTITTRQMTGGIQLMVKDNGIGIPDALQYKIFNGTPETRRIGTAGEVSHGLGLPICKKLIEESGGTISFQSRSGKGTIFYIWLPIAEQKSSRDDKACLQQCPN